MDPSNPSDGRRQKAPASASDPGPGEAKAWLGEVEIRAGLLAGVGLFAGLSPSDLHAIADDLAITRYRPGELVTSPADRDERMYIVKDGRLRLYRIARDGRQLTLDVLDRGTAIGRLSWFGRELMDAYAEALEESLVCNYTAAEFERLISRYPVIGMNVIRYLSQRLSTAERELEAMAYRNVDQRLALRLLRLAERFGEPANGGVAVDARLTQQDLAEMVGVTRETVALAMGRLRRRGLADMSQHRVVILDRHGLAALAGE